MSRRNPNIDSGAYLRLASQAIAHREPRRLSEEEFIRLARKPGVVILDARSAAKYQALHVKGAINLSFPDITVDSLNALLPDKSATILIYCNNNFRDAPDPMPSQADGRRAQPRDVHVALHVWLSQRVRARAEPVGQDDAHSVRRNVCEPSLGVSADARPALQ